MKNTIRKINKKVQKDKLAGYYKNQLHKDQPFHWRIINYFLARLLVFIGAFSIFIYVTAGEKVYASFITSISVLIIYHLVSMTLEKKKLASTIKEVNDKIATEEFWKKVKSLDKEAFVTFIKEILENLPGFSEVETVNYLESEGINIFCKYKGELIAIQCHQLDGENAVEPKEARELSRAMSRRKYKKAIIISTTDFRDDTKVFCETIKDKRQITLLDKNEFIAMAKQAGKFPVEEEVKNIILKKMEHRERLWRDAQNKIFAKPRVMSYFIYGTFLIILSMVIDSSLIYFYYSGAVILYSLGIIAFILSIVKKKNQPLDDWQNLI